MSPKYSDDSTNGFSPKHPSLRPRPVEHREEERIRMEGGRASCMAGGRARGIRLSMHYDNNNSLIDGRRTKGLTDFHSLSFEPNRPKRRRRRRRRFSNKQGSPSPSPPLYPNSSLLLHVHVSPKPSSFEVEIVAHWKSLASLRDYFVKTPRDFSKCGAQEAAAAPMTAQPIEDSVSNALYRRWEHARSVG